MLQDFRLGGGGPEDRVLGWPRAVVARAARPPGVSFQVRAAGASGQVEVGLGAGGAGPGGGLSGKLLLRQVSEVRCSQEPTRQRGRICGRAEGLEAPLSGVPGL